MLPLLARSLGNPLTLHPASAAMGTRRIAAIKPSKLAALATVLSEGLQVVVDDRLCVGGFGR